MFFSISLPHIGVQRHLVLYLLSYLVAAAKLLQSCPTLCNPMDCIVFSRPEYWNGQPFPSPGDLPNPGIEPMSICLSVSRAGVRKDIVFQSTE